MLEFTIDRGYDGAGLESVKSLAQCDETTPPTFVPAVANLGGLPTEIVLAIAASLLQLKDIASLVYQNRRLHYILRGLLLRRNVETERSSALIWAASKNRLALARDLLEAGADTCAVIQGYFSRRTPLNEACRNGNIEMVELLVDAGADVLGPPHQFWERQTDRYQEPLSIAMATRQLALCHALISRLSAKELNSPVYPRERGETPMQLAASYGLPSVVHHLFEKGAVARSTVGTRWIPSVGSPLQLCLQGDWVDPKKQKDYLQTVMLLLERWDGVPKPVRVSDDARSFRTPDQIRFTNEQSWRGLEDPILFGRYHTDPRVRVLFSRDEFPFERRGVGERPAGYWMTGITHKEEIRIQPSSPARAIFDTGMFEMDRNTRKLKLDRPFPPTSRWTDIFCARSSSENLCKCIRVGNLIFTGRNCATDCAGLEHSTSR
jgi:hypothetical protein